MKRRRSWLVCGLSQMLLLCCATGGRAADQPPAMLSHAAFVSSSSFIERTARPLERTLFSFYFEHGSRDAVIAELAKFQNADGGFASCIESDTRWCGSSPLGAMKALGILTSLEVPGSDPHVHALLEYLQANFDRRGLWHALPKEANVAPHAPWWDVRADTGAAEIESAVFPTAALAGYLQNYAGLLPPGFVNRVTESSLNYLAAAPVKMKMPDVESLNVLVDSLPPGRRTAAVDKLKRVIAALVVQDPRLWTSYNVKPLTFVHSPRSPFYPGSETGIAANLDYIISTQKDDGGWGLTWSWGDRDAAAWKVAEKEWRGVVALENLRTLQAFHRLELSTGIGR